MNLSRQSSFVAGIAVVALLLTGCGKDQGQAVTVKGGANGLSAAASTTADETFTFEVEARVELGDGSIQTTTSEGAVDGTRSTMTMHLPVPGAKVTMQLVADDGHQYFRYEGMPAGGPLPEGWIELVGQGTAEAVLSTTSITSFLERFAAKDSKVDDKGTVRRDGADYHRYETHVDMSSAYEVTTSNRVMQRMMDVAAEANSDLEATIDVDSENRIARIVYENDVAIGHTTATITLRDFGAPVDIDVPTDAEPYTLDEFAALAYGGGDTGGEVEEIDPDELISRDDFVDMVGDQPQLNDELAECVYDELIATNPGVLRSDALAADDLGTEARQAFITAGTVCGMSGG